MVLFLYLQWLTVSLRPRFIGMNVPAPGMTRGRKVALMTWLRWMYSMRHSRNTKEKVVSGTLGWKRQSCLAGAVYYAMRNNSAAISGKRGAVIGSTQPWVEIYALKLNASHVTTMEYMKILTEHPKMSYEHPVQVAKNYQKWLLSLKSIRLPYRHIEAYDWIATYSSLEHSGLGRYGDALDPVGDLKESMKMLCMLKKGGYLFLGLPVGYDTIYFNWHRIYGRIRLALMMAGWLFQNSFEYHIFRIRSHWSLLLVIQITHWRQQLHWGLY